MMRALPRLALLSATLISIAAPARAETSTAAPGYANAGATSAPPQAPSRTWYGWQILLADVPAYVLFALSNPYTTQYGQEPSFGFIGAAEMSYLVVAPLVHTAQGRGGIAFASFGLRVPMSTVSFFTGILAPGCHDQRARLPEREVEYEDCSGVFAALTFGAAMGTAIDAFALGWKRAPRVDATPSARASPFAISPVVSPGFVGLTGTF
jgi:hypothetical protein